MGFRKDWLARWAEYAPIKVVVSDSSNQASLTYWQLNSMANYLSRNFEELGLAPGDRVAVLSEYCLEYIVLLGVAMKLGITIVPLNYRLSARELAFMINNSEPEMLVYEKKFSALIDESLLEKEINHRLLMSDIETDLGSKTESDFTYSSKELAEDHPLFIMYTSGTTGFPKGAIYTHKMAFWNAINTQIRLDITSRDHTVICTPPFHTGGWNVLLIPFLLQGASFTLVRKFDAVEILKLLDEEEATLFMGVPTMLKMLAEAPEFQNVNLEALRYFVVGGEAMPLPLIETWKKKGIPVRQGFGLTEVGPNVFSLHHDDAIRKIGSIGTPNFFVDTKLVKLDGTEAGLEEEGELWLKGPIATPGYWRNKSATEDSFKDGWFKTGDILVQDSEGYYYVKDRIKNMFISGGENVYPAEVERFLLTHPMIDEVAVIGVPDERWGEVGKAFIVCSQGALSSTDIMDYCAGKLAKFKIPKHIENVNEIPKTDSGKIDRKGLEGL